MINIQKTADELVKIINDSGLVNELTAQAILDGLNYQEKITNEEGEIIDNPVTSDQHIASRLGGFIRKATKRGFDIQNKRKLNEMGL